MPFPSVPSRSVSLTQFCLHIWLLRLTAVYKSNCLFFSLLVLRRFAHRWKEKKIFVAFRMMWPFLVFVRPRKEKGEKGREKMGANIPGC